MDNKLLNLAEQAGMRYNPQFRVFYFDYDHLEEFFKLCLQQHEHEKSNQDGRVL